MWFGVLVLWLVSVSLSVLVAAKEKVQRNNKLLNAYKEAIPEITLIEKDFGVGGMHGSNRPDLWLKGAGQIIPQFNELIDIVSPGFKLENMSVEEGKKFYKMEEYSALVSELGNRLKAFGSDKSKPYQHYHHVYTYIFEAIRAVKKTFRTLEIGKYIVIILIFSVHIPVHMSCDIVFW